MNSGVKHVEIDSRIKLAYQLIDNESSNKPLLVFLHEGLGSIAQWKNFPLKLTKLLGLDGLIYERYGYGYSTPFMEPREPDYLYKEAEYFLPIVLEKLGFNQREIILVGHSDGASIALIYAALFPQNVKTVISMAAHVFVDELSIKGIKEADAIYAANDDLKNKLKKYHFDHVDSTFYAWSKMWQTEEFAKFNMEHLLSKIIAPILAIQGVQDEYGLPSQVESIVQKGSSSNNKKLFIDNCQHSPHLQAQEKVLQQIQLFLNKNIS